MSGSIVNFCFLIPFSFTSPCLGTSSHFYVHFFLGDWIYFYDKFFSGFFLFLFYFCLFLSHRECTPTLFEPTLFSCPPKLHCDVKKVFKVYPCQRQQQPQTKGLLQNNRKENDAPRRPLRQHLLLEPLQPQVLHHRWKQLPRRLFPRLFR